jgi:outer membrane protein TolC
MTRHLFPSGRVIAVGSAIAFFAGCTSFSQDGGFNAVSNVASERLGKDATWVKTDQDRDAVAKRTQELLSKPLGMDDAVQVALLNNRGLQASYSELGISEAALVQAGRLPNPGFTFSRTSSNSSDVIVYNRSWTFDLLSALMMPITTRVESRKFEQTKLLTANGMLTVAADTRRAYVNAVAAQQGRAYAEQVKDAAEAAAQLAQRMQQAGNFSKLDYAREQAFYAEAVALLARSQQLAVSAREKLTRSMGLWGSAIEYKLPEHLPDLPNTRPELTDLESFAMENRLDIQAAKMQTQSVASSLGLSRVTRFINVLDVGYLNDFENDQGHERGYQISVEVPIFDWGSAKVARAKATYLQSVNRVAETAVNARSEVRESYSSYVTDYDIAKHYRDEVIPLRKTIADEMLLRYNGMLVSVFELLSDAREQAGAVNSYIDALKAYWLADTDLQQAVGGRLPSTALAQSIPAPATQAAPPSNSEGK